MTTASDGHFVWYEHRTKDPRRAQGFYGEVVGWKTQPFGDDGKYVMWVGSQGPLGGVMELPEAAAKMGAPPHWMAHVQVANVDATVEKVKSLGGKIYNGPEEVPTVGRFAIVADPQGAAISVFTPEKPMERHDLVQPGEFAWNELVTSDLDAGWSFYEKVFGWKKVEDMDMGPMGIYRTFGLGEEMVGGMMKAPDGMPMPTAWLYYVGVDDLDAAIARATKQGAKVISGPMDIPGGGRIAQLFDDQGAAFALHTGPKT